MTIRRLKTYTGSTGYVYQYYFVGKQAAGRPRERTDTAEYVFDVSADRKHSYPVRVLLESSTLMQWARQHGRTLTDAEQYAAVKMRLFQAFDELDDLSNQGRVLKVDFAALETALVTLGIE